jgi:hypothetical protein
MIPPFERRLLRTVREGVAADPVVREWPSQSLDLCLDVLRRIRKSTVDTRLALENQLAEGVEARAFGAAYGQYLPTAEEHVAIVRELVEALSPGEDAASQSLLSELHVLEEENKALRDLLAEALARASEPLRPADWNRIRAAEEAHAHGETRRWLTGEPKPCCPSVRGGWIGR